MPDDYPTITIRDLVVVATLLNECLGPGAYRRAASTTGASLSLVNASVGRVERLLGHKLLEIEREGRRESRETKAGEAFRLSVADVLDAWDKLVKSVAKAAAMDHL
jgi:DNA-binding transcriptional LysR family regulator